MNTVGYTYYFYCAEGTNHNGVVKKISGVFVSLGTYPDKVYKHILEECKEKLPYDRVVLLQFNKVG